MVQQTHDVDRNLSFTGSISRSNEKDPRVMYHKGIKDSLFTHMIMQPTLQRQIIIVPTQRRRRSSGSASPGPGISISWNGNSVKIVANLQISGLAASLNVANDMKSAIERIWNGSFADGYDVTCTSKGKLSDSRDG